MPGNLFWDEEKEDEERMAVAVGSVEWSKLA